VADERAREAAFRAWWGTVPPPTPILPHEPFNAGYDSGRRDAEERTSAALPSADSMMTLLWHRYRHAIPDDVADDFEAAMLAVLRITRARP
jgi:hypothetical protein